MADGSTKAYGALVSGDEVKSVSFAELTSSDLPSVFLNESSNTLTPTATTSIVKRIRHRSDNHYFNINNGIKVTAEHPLLIKRDGTWSWKRVWALQTGDMMYGSDNSEVEITSLTYVSNDWIDIVSMNVEDEDCYFVHGILAHNKF